MPHAGNGTWRKRSAVEVHRPGREAPGRRNPGEPGLRAPERFGRGTPQPCRGSKPLKRGRERAQAHSCWLAGTSVIRNCPGRTERNRQGNLPVKPWPEGLGGNPGPVRRTRSGMSGPRTPGSQSHEGMCGREAGRSLFGKALKGEPRERARLRDTGETVTGARRRGTQEVRGCNMTRVRQAREWWLGRLVALRGEETSGERTRRLFGARIPGHHSEAGCKLAEGSQSLHTDCA
jgi:hypothetical protein